MFVFFIERKGYIHIVDYKSSRGFYRSICGKVAYHNELINTLASDASIDVFCKSCHNTYNEMYISDLDIEPRMARNNTHLNLSKLLEYVKAKFVGPEAEYSYLLKHRVTTKLNRYKLLPNKVNKYAK